MALTIEGTGGGQEGARRAAMQYMAPGRAAAPTMGQGQPAPQSSLGDTLATAVQQTSAMASTPEGKQAVVSAWSQAWEMLKGILQGAQQGAAPSPSPTGNFQGAQAMAPMVGRPPR